MRKLINRLKELFLYCDYMEFNRVLTNKERDDINDYINGKKYMAHKPGTAPVKEKKARKPAGVIGSQGSFVI